MVTVVRQFGLSVVIYKDDHPPPHVHIIGDGRAKIFLAGPDGSPELDDSFGFTAGDLRKAMKLVRENQHLLLERWKEIHGGID